MTAEPTPDAQERKSPSRRAFEFARDFAAYAGKKGILAAGCIGLGALLEGAGLLLLIPILAVAGGGGAGSNRLMAIAGRIFAGVGADSKFTRLAWLLAAFLFLVALRSAVLYLRDVTLVQLQTGFVAQQRLQIARKLVAARWDVIARLWHAKLLNVMNANTASIGGAANFLLQCIVSVTMLVSQCLIAIFLSPVLAVMVIAAMAVGTLSLGVVIRRADEMGRFVTAANLSLVNSTTQLLGGLKLAMSQNLQGSFLAEFRGTLDDMNARQVGYARRRALVRMAVVVVVALVSALAVLAGVGFLGVPPAVLIALLFLLARMNGPIMQIQQGVQQFATALPAYDRIRQILDELEPAQPEDMGDIVPPPAGPIVFRGVDFCHAGAAAGLAGIDLRIEEASSIGIAGASGAGKTTFADLLVGLYPPQKGEISVGGAALRGGSLNAWRRSVSYVSQDPFLFHDTIRRNFLWAAPAVTDADLWNALQIAGADDLVRRLEKGLDTVVGERGTLISGGERQRLALARAILRRPRLLVLDEATNAIDSEAEHEIQARLFALRPRPTIVIIAHRPDSVRLCERILLFKDGRLVDSF